MKEPVYKEYSISYKGVFKEKILATSKKNVRDHIKREYTTFLEQHGDLVCRSFYRMKNFKIELKKTLLFLLFPFIGLSQKVDTIVSVENYKSYINYEYKQPVQVSYIAWKGGGNCDRTHFRFKNRSGIELLNASNYGKSGFDTGHLAPAELFAYDCKLDSLTFWFGNAEPQKENLNRGVWAEWERFVVNLSQVDSLLINCGGTNFKWSKKLNGYYPTYCWKTIYSIKSKRYVKVLLFTNSNKATVKEISIEKLEKILERKV